MTYELTNGDAEDGLTGWVTADAENWPLTLVSSPVRNGSGAFALTYTGDFHGGFGFNSYQDIRLIQGNTYTYSGWARTDGTWAGRPDVSFGFYSPAGAPLSSQAINGSGTTTTTWAEVTGSFAATVTGTHEYVGLQVSPILTALTSYAPLATYAGYFDDITLTGTFYSGPA